MLCDMVGDLVDDMLIDLFDDMLIDLIDDMLIDLFGVNDMLTCSGVLSTICSGGLVGGPQMIRRGLSGTVQIMGSEKMIVSFGKAGLDLGGATFPLMNACNNSQHLAFFLGQLLDLLMYLT